MSTSEEHRRPILFAHRGASAHAAENTIDAFRLALAMGATGLETDAWLTRDGWVVLDHDGALPDGRSVASADRHELPPHIPTLDDLYLECGTAFELSIDIKDPAVVGPLGRVARRVGADHRLWICDPFWRRMPSWRRDLGSARLVNSTMVGYMTGGTSGRRDAIVGAGLDAINLHASEWTAERVALFAGAGLRLLGWDAQEAKEIRRLLQLGIDGVFGDHVDRLVETAADVAP